MIYGILQYIGLDPISYDLPFEEGRVFSTLGNANTFAIFLLLFLPVTLLGFRGYLRIGAALVLLMTIFATGSLSASVVALLTITWTICYRSGAPKWWYGICLGIISITCLQFILSTLGHEKWLSMLTRLTLLFESYKLLMAHPLGFLVGIP